MKSWKSQFLLIATLAFGIGLWIPGAEAAALKRQITSCGSIVQPGLYTLTQNITATGDCLVVQVDFVTIDLNFFTVTGNGTGSGITDSGATLHGIAIRDGTISNFEYGINFSVLTENTSVERMRVIGNGKDGTRTGQKAIVKDSIFSGNGTSGGYNGLIVGEGSVVTGNIANNNDAIGIALGAGQSTAIGNVAMGNGVGIQVFTGGGTIVNNTASGNQFGFIIQCASNLIGNTAIGNSGTDLELQSASQCNNNNNVAINVSGTP